ncbi:MAG: tape measure protein, partial [Porticoccaceae bacterium]|nr:tape measure protein [Porticoccaceae bacterium]
MARDFEMKLVIRGDARGGVEALRITDGELQKLNQTKSKGSSAASGLTQSWDGLTKQAMRLGAVAAGALSVRKVIDYADTWSDLTSRVRLSIGAHDDAGRVMGRLESIARMTYSSLENTADSFARNAFTLNALGKSTEEQLDYTEALNNALVVSGAKGQALDMVQNSLNRAMAEGTLRGTELQNVLNYGSRVAQALAEHLKVNVTELRALAAEGKITGEVIYEALVGAQEAVRAESESMPATVGDGFIQIQNSTLSLVGALDQATGASEGLSTNLLSVADGIAAIGDAVRDGSVAAGIRDIFGELESGNALLEHLSLMGEVFMNIHTAPARALLRRLPGNNLDRLDEEIERLEAIHGKYLDGTAGRAPSPYQQPGIDRLAELRERRELILAMNGDAEALASTVSRLEAELGEVDGKIYEIIQKGGATRRSFAQLEDLSRQREGIADTLQELREINIDSLRIPDDLLNRVSAFQGETDAAAAAAERKREAIKGVIESLQVENLRLTEGERAAFAYRVEHDEVALSLYDQNEALKAGSALKQENARAEKELEKLSARRAATLSDQQASVDLLERELAAHLAGEDAIRAFNREKAIELALRSENARILQPEERDRYAELLGIQYDLQEAIRETAAATYETGDGMALLMEETSRRMGDSLVQVWRDFIDGGSNALDSMKKMLVDFLANAAHLALTRPIMVSLGLAGSVGANAGGIGGGAAGGAG